MSVELDNEEYRLQRLFDGYVFHIPEYQRFYSWTEQHWDDLWHDLLNIDERDPYHYMGTVICKDEETSIETEEYTTNYRKYGIVDGQQRFTTLVILVKALVSSYDSMNEEELSEQARERYKKLEQGPIKDCRELFVRDPAMETSNEGYEVRNKLKLQKEDNEPFKEIIQEDVEKNRLDTPSQRRLVEAYEFYEERLEKLREQQSYVKFLHQLGRLLSGIQALQFMVYTINDKARATLIFESINDRGKGLSNLDKTKSFLMHKVYLTGSDENPSEITIDDVQRRFGRIYRSLQTIDDAERTSGISEDRIQRYHYISTVDQSVNSTYIKEETNRRNRTLRSGATVYLGALKWHFTQLQNGAESGPYGSYKRDCINEVDWYTNGLSRYYSHMETIARYGNRGDYDPDLDWELRKLFVLGRLGNLYPLLLTLWNEYEDDQLTREELYEILQLIEVASFRIYLTPGIQSDKGRSDFYDLANSVATGDKEADWIISELKDYITSHEYDFIETLRTSNAFKRFRYKDIRYLLYSYELYLKDEGMGGVEAGFETAVENADNHYTIEHIWPQDASKLELTEDEQRIHEDIKHSLGNLTLAVGSRGSSWGNLPYSQSGEDNKEKRHREDGDSYRDSDFQMTRKIAREFETWGKEQIDSRLENLIEYAEKRWSLDADEREPYASIKPSEVE
jgi:hypothetical protein